MQLAMMEATNWDGVFVADLAAERARLGKANVMRLARRPAADDAGLGCYIFAVLLVAQANGLDRTRRRRVPAGPGWRIGSGGGVGRGGERFFNRRIGLFRQRRPRFFRGPTDEESIVASFSRKPTSTLSASVTISVFLAERLLWTQCAASSAVCSRRSASNRSRTAADCSGPRGARGGA